MGEIVVTSFNKTYPLIRLATGDLSYIDRAPCACGRTSPRLGSIVGRVDTTARIKGMFVYPHQVEQVMARFEDIKRWQIEVINPGGIDEMILYVEASNFHQRRRAAAPLPRTHQAASRNSRCLPPARCLLKSSPSKTSANGISFRRVLNVGEGRGKLSSESFPLPSPTPPPLPFQDFRLYRIPHPGLSSFVGTGLICLSARLVRLALVPPTAVNVTGISRVRGIDARRVGARAMPNRTCGLYGNIPKMNTKKQRHSVRKRGKTLSQVPSRSFFP